MSATIYWTPLATSDQTLGVSSPSSFVESMKECFGDWPKWRLDERHIPTLTGMAAAASFENRKDNPYRKMIEKIQNNGEPRAIEVWAEY